MNPDLIRRIALGLVAVGGVSLVIWLVGMFVYNGGITIKGGDSSLSVTITDANGVVVVRGKANQYRLGPGQYRVVATTSKAGVARVVQVSPLSNNDVTIGQTTLLHANIALKSSLYGVVPYGKWFIGYDPTSQTIKRYDSSGLSTNRLGSPAAIGQEGEWDPEIPDVVSAYQPYSNQRVITSSDGYIYVVSAGAVNEVNLTGIELKNNNFENFVVGSNNNQDAFAVGYNRSVYWYTDANAKPKKVYTNKTQFDQMAVGGDYAVLYSTALPNAREDIRASYSDYQIDAQVVNTKTGKTYTLNGPISSVTVSPDGKYATVKPRGQSAYLYNLLEQKQVVNIEQPDSAAPFWISPTTYIYEKNKIVWRYNTVSQSSDELAGVGNTVTSFSTDGKGGYFATYYDSSNDCGVINLSQTALPDAVVPIQQVVPYSGDGYSIDYSNVNGPTISITTQAILNRADQLPQYRAQTQAYRAAALDYLKSKGIDITKFTIVYDPADPL